MGMDVDWTERLDICDRHPLSPLPTSQLTYIQQAGCHYVHKVISMEIECILQ